MAASRAWKGALVRRPALRDLGWAGGWDFAVVRLSGCCRRCGRVSGAVGFRVRSGFGCGRVSGAVGFRCGRALGAVGFRMPSGARWRFPCARDVVGGDGKSARCGSVDAHGCHGDDRSTRCRCVCSCRGVCANRYAVSASRPLRVLLPLRASAAACSGRWVRRLPRAPAVGCVGCRVRRPLCVRRLPRASAALCAPAAACVGCRVRRPLCVRRSLRSPGAPDAGTAPWLPDSVAEVRSAGGWLR
ncbi:hypothetical protein CLV67_116149 [Actinoplanes italicus]|uniref:Uncharacterized protein n=1 Tax=Actinoplanes italicus TaxID=113567 RepID=A0A2T0K3D5_9ACTN|nr:hypothetical protein CLV67_116149 [Actinoplanes italicus]